MQRLSSFLLTLVLLAVTGFPLEAQSKVKLQAYKEYQMGRYSIIEGQRVVSGRKTKYKGQVRGLESIPLGYRVKVEGTRQQNGEILAKKIEAKPNQFDSLDQQIVNATDQLEQAWVKEGVMFTTGPDGKRQEVGKIVDSGPQVSRVRRIMDRLLPPYVNSNKLRVRVVETKEWNASAMGNGAIWVYSGLLNEMKDDELAIILGHELAHYTYEHTRRSVEKSQWTQLLAIGGIIGGSVIGGSTGDLVALGSTVGVGAMHSGYSRDLEDQADRVGLRYAYEGEYDVGVGPRLWSQFREKYGESGKLENYLAGSHSRPSDRIRNLERELRMNYRDARP